MSATCYVQLEGERHLGYSSAESMLKLAVSKYFKGPFCKQLAATHAAGVAVAGFAAEELAHRISLLYDHADFCLGEARLEKVYLLAQLMQHHDLLQDLLNLSSHQCPEEFRERISAEIQPAEDADSLDSRGSLEDLGAQFRALFALLSDLESDVVAKMGSRIAKLMVADAEMDADCKGVFKPSLKKAVKDLEAIRKCLAQILATLKALIGEVQKDWALDCRQLKKACDLC